MTNYTLPQAFTWCVFGINLFTVLDVWGSLRHYFKAMSWADIPNGNQLFTPQLLFVDTILLGIWLWQHIQYIRARLAASEEMAVAEQKVDPPQKNESTEES